MVWRDSLKHLVMVSSSIRVEGGVDDSKYLIYPSLHKHFEFDRFLWRTIAKHFLKHLL